jgi:hypothetical protein
LRNVIEHPYLVDTGAAMGQANTEITSEARHLAVADLVRFISLLSG